jgi:hypothetical protein
VLLGLCFTLLQCVTVHHHELIVLHNMCLCQRIVTILQVFLAFDQRGIS